jgi:hypothetical protein
MNQRRENANDDADADLGARTLRGELACARTLLDELVTVLEARNDERTRCDVVEQVAEQLDRVAETMRSWAKARDRRDVPESGVVLSPSSARPSMDPRLDPRLDPRRREG